MRNTEKGHEGEKRRHGVDRSPQMGARCGGARMGVGASDAPALPAPLSPANTRPVLPLSTC